MGKQEIKTVSFVHAGDRLADTAELTEEESARLGTWLKAVCLNDMFQGRAVFHGAGDFCQEKLSAKKKKHGSM